MKKDKEASGGAIGERRRVFTTSNPTGRESSKIISTDTVPGARARAGEVGRIMGLNVTSHKRALAERLQKMGVTVREEKDNEA